MTCVRMLLVGMMAAVSIAAADDPPRFGTAFVRNSLSTVSNPNARLRPAEPDAPACVELPATPALPVTDDPPPFGTVIQQWQLGMSGSYAGAGITWRRDSGRLYLMDQGYSGGSGVWSCDPADPPGTIRRENWAFPNMGSGTTDIPWGIAWDSDSNCFWISNIVDRNTDAGCYYVRMRQTPVGDTWRWFSENPGDTWLVGDGSGGGAGNMYWLAGSEKCPGHDYFACAPVASGFPYNNVWKFDPYTKSDLGRVAYGNALSERGCTLVPYDSNYILTCGWNDNVLVKRDSTGLALDSVPGTVYGPADVAAWVPENTGPDDTVFMYCICTDPNNTLQKLSVGMLWSQLPSYNPSNVRPLSVLAPSGMVDSGQSVTPRLVVRNTGRVPADGVSAYFTIDADGVPVYTDSITGMFLDVRTTETLGFTDWTPCGRDTMSVIAWTRWQGDSFPKDDTIRNRFLVRIRDIAVTEIVTPAPDTVVDSGAVFAPQCRAWNFGNVALNFDVEFRIGAYRATRNVNLIPGGAKLSTAPEPYTAVPGIWLCRAFAVVPGDLHPENNSKADTFTVRGMITKDVEARAVLAPTGVVDTMLTIMPSARYGNNGVDVAVFRTYFSIRDSSGAEVYAESLQILVRPSDSVDIEYPVVRFTVTGSYTAICSVAMDGDQNTINDIALDTFTVTATGVAEGPAPAPRFGLAPIANPCRVTVPLACVLPPEGGVLKFYDVSGRVVLNRNLAGGRSVTMLDLRRLSTGVYLIRLSAGSLVWTEKLTLQR